MVSACDHLGTVEECRIVRLEYVQRWRISLNDRFSNIHKDFFFLNIRVSTDVNLSLLTQLYSGVSLLLPNKHSLNACIL